MAGTDIRVNPRTHAALRDLAEQQRRSIGQVVSDAVEKYREDFFWQELEAGLTNLKADPVAWQDYQDEIALWDRLSGDGLEWESPYEVGKRSEANPDEWWPTLHFDNPSRPDRRGCNADRPGHAVRSAAVGLHRQFMAWEPEAISVTPEHLTGMITNVLEADGRVIGFYVLGGEGSEMELSRLMIEPDRFGTGCGRRLWDHAVETARALGAEVITLDSDPNAEPFYQRMGAVTIGEQDWTPPMMPGWRVRMMRYVIPSRDAPTPG